MSLKQARARIRAGRPLAAVAILETYLVRHASEAEAWFLLGACRHALEDLTGATAAFSRSVELEPEDPEPYLALAAVAREAGDRAAAFVACERGLEEFPSEARLFHAKASALEDLGRTEEALTQYEQALKLAPQCQDTLHDIGLLLTRMGRLRAAELHYRTYVEAHPASPAARAGLTDTWLALGRYDEVIAFLGSATGDASMLVRLGFALAARRRFKEAREAFDLARATDARAVDEFVGRMAQGKDLEATLSPENIFLDRCYAALCQCDWSTWDAMIAEARQAGGTSAVALEPAVAFMVRFLPLSGAERHAISRQVATRIESTAPVLSAAAGRSRQRIRIGVISPDFREHINAYLLLPLFELLDRTRFEVHAYSLAPDDGSVPRARIHHAADLFLDLHDMSDDEAARLIRRNDVDIVVDASGYTTGSRFAIVARRPARLHVNYLGLSSSIGSTRVDYAIADRTSVPLPEEWTEALAYLPDTFFLYDYRAQVPQIPISRRDYGVPEEAFVYCAFHRAEKVSPDAFSLWMQVLTQVPRSVMWFYPLPPTAAANVRSEASRWGIASSRLIFAPFEPRDQPRYLARQRLGDVMLDTLHHNAMTTACDALGVGLPVLTLPGSAIAARAGSSLVTAAGLPQLVSADPAEFVQTAVRLASDPALLGQYRQTLASNRSRAPLFDTPKRVRDLGAAFEQMVLRWERGEVPSSFDV